MSSLSPDEKEEHRRQRHEEARQREEERVQRRQARFERAKKGTRALFGHVPTMKLDHFPPLERGFVSTGVKPCRELLILRGVRQHVLEDSADPRMRESERNEVFSEAAPAPALEKHLLNLSVPERFSKYELDMQFIAGDDVYIVARARTKR